MISQWTRLLTRNISEAETLKNKLNRELQRRKSWFTLIYSLSFLGFNIWFLHKSFVHTKEYQETTDFKSYVVVWCKWVQTALACNAFDFIFLLTKAIKVVNPPPLLSLIFFKVTLDNLLSGSCSVWLRFKVLTLSAFISFFCKILTKLPKANIQNHQQSHDTTYSKTLHVDRYT